MILTPEIIKKLGKLRKTKNHEWAVIDKKSLKIINTARHRTAAIRYAKVHGNAALYNIEFRYFSENLTTGAPNEPQNITKLHTLVFTTTTRVWIDEFKINYDFIFKHGENFITVTNYSTGVTIVKIPIREHAPMNTLKLTIYRWLNEQKYNWRVVP